MRAATIVVYAVAGVIAALSAALSWRRRGLTPLTLPLGVIMAGVAEWSLAQAFAVAAPTAALAILCGYAIFPGVAAVSAGYYWYSRALTGYQFRRMCPRLLLLIHPVLLVAVVATDPWHHLFYRLVEVTAAGEIVTYPGPAYWVHTAYCYTLLGVGTTLVVRAMRRAVRGERRLFAAFLVGAAAPTIGNLATLFLDVDAHRFDLTPVLFLVTGVVWAWAERRGLGAAQVPVTYGQIIEALTDAVMVLDPHGRFLEINPAAAALLGLHPQTAGPVVGRHWQQVTGTELAGIFAETGQSTITTPAAAVYDVRVVRMSAADGSCPGTVVVVRDVTELERLRAELVEQAARDGLTGVYNRRHLACVLEAKVREASAGGHPLSAVMIDVDHFKSVNDTYGHAVGDQVLVRLAAVLTSSVRETDIVARYGGEEFAVLMPGVGALDAADRADELRRRCVSAVLDTPLGPLHITFSAGVAQLPLDGRPGDLLRLADQALYAAKEGGRDRVVVVPASLPPSTQPA
jgi:diguanylate cyclase (GGDEF)-like protein/PAS domain S-box-containing protein